MDMNDVLVFKRDADVMKKEITAAIDELQRDVRLLIDLPGRVTINTREYCSFYDKVLGFAGRYNLIETREWGEVNRWLIKKPNEYLTLEEAGYLKLALEKLRTRAFEIVGEGLTEDEKTRSEERIDESFSELREIGHKQIELLNNQIGILKNNNKSVQRWNVIMFVVAIVSIAISITVAFLK